MDDKIKCLYYIKDTRTDKIIYIGQTVNFKNRKRSHFGHKERPVDKYMFKEGRNNFLMEKFDIDCTNMAEDEILNKEDELILEYDTINNGVNIERSGMISYNTDFWKDYRNKYMKEYNKKDERKEWIKEYKKGYYQNNKEKLKEQSREIYNKIKDSGKYLEYLEKKREYKKQWRLKKKQEKTALSEG